MKDTAKRTETQLWDYADCPCRGSVTMRRAPNRVDTSVFEIGIWSCPHYLAAEQLYNDLSYWIPTDEHARFQRDLDRPGGAEQLPEHRLINAMHVYEDRTVEISWTRDVHRGADGALKVQDTETYFIALRPRRAGDRERVTLDLEPVITGAPKCRRK